MKDDSKALRKRIQKRLPSDMDMDPHIEQLMYMDYMMFMERLAEEASKVAKENNRTKVSNDDIMKVAKDVLHEFHG
ncbi:hypothetical protein BDC45DRAFT_520413 [Circinella umbellata]|nr:hypothetical protein BDC45DRAFT_520413 [Circinella umbellata]